MTTTTILTLCVGFFIGFATGVIVIGLLEEVKRNV